MSASGQIAWSYDGTDDPKRLVALLRPISFPEVVHRLKDEMTTVCFHRDARSADPSFSRAIFCVHVGFSLFDLFFNSPTGYRGAYFSAPESGIEANRLLFDNLSPALVEWAIARQGSENRDWMLESLSQSSAKAWLAEESRHLCGECAGEWGASHVPALTIVNSRWESSLHTHAGWGRQAPRLTKLRFLGGFVNGAHEEWLPEGKQNRARDIWEHGWT